MVVLNKIYTRTGDAGTTALGNGDNYHVFRGDRPPAWEAMPNCGTWLYRLDRASPELDALWERLLLAMVGESLGEPCVAGPRAETGGMADVDPATMEGDYGHDY